tara:strand:- start:24283 stop:24504 length:222 start_codon:yes stop_codon:yes gene_type:complete
MNNEDKKEKEIKQLKYKIEVLEERIEGLEKDLEYIVENSPDFGMIKYCIEELQEEVAKLANQPVGILFTRLKK